MNSPKKPMVWRLVLAFVALDLFLCGFIPWLGWQYVQNSEKVQAITVQLSSGSATVTRPELGIAESMPASLDGLSEGSQLVVSPDSQVVVVYKNPEDGQILETLQLYGNTLLTLTSHRLRRFEWSRLPNQTLLTLEQGRMRLLVSNETFHNGQIQVQTPHGLVEITQPGAYSIEIIGGSSVRNANTDVIVSQGQATVVVGEQRLLLQDRQRALLDGTNLPTLDTNVARNLVLDNNFLNPLGNTWQAFQKRDLASDPEGLIESISLEGFTALHFQRIGTRWGEVGVTQPLNRDVRDYTRVVLSLAALIKDQSLPVCGIRGSECPLMVKIVYIDASGKENEWLQGFYSQGTPSNTYPNRCVTCASLTNEHIRVNAGFWRYYDTDNLIQVLTRNGSAPVTLKSITLYAQGHTFDSYVSQVNILAQE
ncbi:MAG TPA: hypothetical protein PK299_07690 [Anaerolineales bacterium]|nr:hypothetical protein [Anaerolineales bacterium]